jgi:hypothetical protein
VRFSTRRGVIGVAVAVVAAACGANSAGQTLSAGDLARITTVRPMTPGWAWPQVPIPPVAASPQETPSGKETPIPTEPDPLADALDRQIRDAGGLVAADGSRWQDEQKLGVTLAWLLKSAAGARTVLAAERVYQRGWVERTVAGGHFTDLPIEELGDEAWRIQSDFPGGQEVTFGVAAGEPHPAGSHPVHLPDMPIRRQPGCACVGGRDRQGSGGRDPQQATHQPLATTLARELVARRPTTRRGRNLIIQPTAGTILPSC